MNQNQRVYSQKMFDTLCEDIEKDISKAINDEVMQKMLDVISTMELLTEDPEARKRYEHLKGLYEDKK